MAAGRCDRSIAVGADTMCREVASGPTMGRTFDGSKQKGSIMAVCDAAGFDGLSWVDARRLVTLVVAWVAVARRLASDSRPGGPGS